MICHLCNTEKKLIKRSHIIPNFLYEGLFNEKHFLADVDLKGNLGTRSRPSGSYDSDILCESCDNEVLGRLESYCKVVLFGGYGYRANSHNIELQFDSVGNRYIHVTNIDYKKFKLFLLSILWKASISKQQFYRFVNLGKKEEVVRRMILDNNPGSENEYPIAIFLLSPNDNRQTKFISNPFPFEFEDNLTYVFLINGMIINYKIAGFGDLDLYKRFMIRENNTMDINILDEKNTIEYLGICLNGKF